MPTEFFKYMDDDCLEIVLEIFNDCWKREVMPSELELAELVTLYKKGNVENPANYRPIALLNTVYKIYASLIQVRISVGLDNSVWDTQYGPRQCRSTSQPLFIT